jgi:hypothetical protein
MTDSPVTVFLGTPFGEAVAITGSLLIAASLFVWAGRLGQLDRWKVVISSAAVGIVVALLNVILGSAGIWRSASYLLPLVILGVSYLLMPMFLCALLLIGYRWLSRHTGIASQLYGLLLVAVFPLIILGDRWALGRGYIAFGEGYYNEWIDAAIGVALLTLPVLLYETLHRAKLRPPSRTMT